MEAKNIKELAKQCAINVVSKRTIPATTIVENVLKQYRLDEVEKKGMQNVVANEILKDLYTSGYLK
jgi:hypothetical protein